MKIMLLSLMLLFAGGDFTFAATAPHCWDDSAEPALVDGSFLIDIHVDQVSKEELLKILEMANGHYIRAKEYPVIFDENVIIVTQAADPGVGDVLSRDELIAAVDRELQPISDMGGVEISCNMIIRPTEKK